MNKTILIAEDEKPISKSLTYCLKKEGFSAYQAFDGKEALAVFDKTKPSLVLLDLMLPKINGIEVCKTIRKQSNVPVIILTAKNSELDKIAGFEIGADDYITKPFSIRELIARINAVLRRSSEKTGQIFKAGVFTLNNKKHEINFNGKKLNLPLKQFNILKTLLIHKNAVVPRKKLLKTVWGEDFYGDEKTLDVHIRLLRQKIENDTIHPKHIKTIRGVGYQLIVEAKE